jgi:hypothetical protein
MYLGLRSVVVLIMKTIMGKKNDVPLQKNSKTLFGQVQLVPLVCVSAKNKSSSGTLICANRMITSKPMVFQDKGHLVKDESPKFQVKLALCLLPQAIVMDLSSLVSQEKDIFSTFCCSLVIPIYIPAVLALGWRS